MKLMYVNREGRITLPVGRIKSESVHPSVPGPSNQQLRSLSRRPRESVPNSQMISVVISRSRWQCRLCGKSLSSKRSYDEHMNIHNDARPFACEHCNYAAASQMTLRRHKLRSHTSRRDWGYKCPYCPETYMEPASYQQHVQSRHYGRSATFGCPYTQCSFLSKCFRHFREHLAKHNNYDSYVGPSDRVPYSFPDDQLTRYLVDDEYGVGYWYGIGKKPKLISKNAFNNTAEDFNLDSFNEEDFMKEPINLKPAISQGAPRRVRHKLSSYAFDVEPPILEEQEMLPVDNDWIETEIEVPSNDVARLPDGQMEIELD
uniref:C2H2-type domain-containing protein n=1 Tax=Heterorhabditis bacteriophora TaxID=37862 RepID=A0A1I7XIW0_HETBA